MTMSHSPSNFFDNKATHKSTTDISGNDENFLKGFSRNFYQKIICTKDLNMFENNLIKWIRSIDKDVELIFKLMQSHEQTDFWFSSIIGFFYQFGLGCDVDKNKALELYLLTVNNDDNEFLNQNFAHLHLLEGNDNEFDALQ